MDERSENNGLSNDTVGSNAPQNVTPAFRSNIDSVQGINNQNTVNNNAYPPLETTAEIKIPTESGNEKDKIKLDKLVFGLDKKEKTTKIIILVVCILSLLANGVLGYFILNKNKINKSQQEIINSKSNCPPEVVYPAESTTEVTPAPAATTTPAPSSSSKTQTQETVILPPPPPSD